MGYRIDPAEKLGEAFRRIAREQLAAVITGLVLTGADRRDAIHNARRRFKALRGLLRLVRPADDRFFARENRRYRDLGRLLARSRDAGALVEAIDRAAALPAATDAEPSLSAVRARFIEREHKIFGEMENPEVEIAQAAAGCRAGLRALDELELPAKPRRAAAVIGRGVGGTYAVGTRALAGVRDSGGLEGFHALRKSVKYHWMHVRLLQAAWPGPMKARRVAAKGLADDLGELNDIAVMLARLKDDPAALGSGDEIEIVARLLHLRRRALERTSIRAADRLFAESPKSVGRRFARYWRLAAGEATHMAADNAGDEQAPARESAGNSAASGRADASTTTTST